MKYNSLVKAAEDADISLELTSLLAQKLPNYQSRWLKGVARVITLVIVSSSFEIIICKLLQIE